MKREKDSKAYGVKGGRLLREQHVRKIHLYRDLSRKGRKTKNVTSCDNVFLTNVLLAWSRARGKRPPVTEYAVKYTF